VRIAALRSEPLARKGPAMRYLIVVSLLLSLSACIPIGVRGTTYAPVGATAVSR